MTASQIPDTPVVTIDIRPGCFPNSIELCSRGVILVAVFASADFDATTIVTGSAIVAYSSDLRKSTLEDVDGDGLIDLLLFFDIESLQPAPGNTVVSLTAKTTDNDHVIGVDSFEVVAP